MGVSFTFTSGKGGTGKSTAVSTIASCLATLGYRTLCIDMDLWLPNLDLLLGMSDLTTLDVIDVATGQHSLASAVAEHPHIPGLFLLAGPGMYDGGVSGQALAQVVEEARDQYDFCLIDGPAGLEKVFHLTAQTTDASIIVSTSDATSQRDAQRVVMELDALGVQDIRMIVNRVRTRVLARSAMYVDDMIDFIGVPLLGIVPEDPDVVAAACRLRPLILYSRRWAAQAFLRISKRIMGEYVPLKHK